MEGYTYFFSCSVFLKKDKAPRALCDATRQHEAESNVCICTFVLAYNNISSYKDRQNEDGKCHPFPKVGVENSPLEAGIQLSLGGKLLLLFRMFD